MPVEQNAYYVHWSNISEWNNVKENILSENMDNVNKAYETMLMWKLRNPNLPAYVECTIGLLDVMIQEHKKLLLYQESDQLPLTIENDLRLSYSAALIRFVNHVSSVSSYKGDTLYLAAKTQNIPDWVINLRHDASHNQILPQLDCLHIAVKLCFKWLIDNYWLSEESAMAELDSVLITPTSVSDKHNIMPILKKAIALWKLSSNAAGSPKKCFADFSKASIMLFKEFVKMWRNNPFAKSAAVEHFEIIRNAVDEALQWQKNKDKVEKINRKQLTKTAKIPEAMLGLIEGLSVKGKVKELLIGALMESKFLSESEIVEKWEQVILLVQRVKALGILIESLLQKAAEGNTLATDWLIALAPSIKSLKTKWNLFKKLQNESSPDTSKKILKERAINSDSEEYPNLKISLAFLKPPKITLEMLRGVLMNPNTIPYEALEEYLGLVDSAIDEAAMDAFKNLISIYCQEDSLVVDENELEDKIFTLDDLKSNEDDLEVTKEADCDVEIDRDNAYSWKKSDVDAEIWSKCAIGLLPNQKFVDCNIPTSVKWIRVDAQSRKRYSVPLIDHAVKVKRFCLVST